LKLLRQKCASDLQQQKLVVCPNLRFMTQLTIVKEFQRTIGSIEVGATYYLTVGFDTMVSRYLNIQKQNVFVSSNSKKKKKKHDYAQLLKSISITSSPYIALLILGDNFISTFTFHLRVCNERTSMVYTIVILIVVAAISSIPA
jgi:hypothetical protein